MSKMEDRLGIKDLATQNQCLLLKFVDELHNPHHLPWKELLVLDLCDDLADGFRPTFYALIIQEEIMTYRALTKAVVRYGQHTSLWLDNW